MQPETEQGGDAAAQATPGGGTRAKIVRMANQIAVFFESKPHDLGVAGVAEHINKFWDPRMRGQLFAILDEAGPGSGSEAHTAAMRPLVLEAAATIRRPGQPVSAEQAHQANAGVPGDKGQASGETKSRIAASQG